MVKLDRPTDVERVGEILRSFTSKLLSTNVSSADSREFRLATELTRVQSIFSHSPESERIPELTELSELVRRAYNISDAIVWAGDSGLATIADGYNAQTLHPSSVAQLLVDDESWTAEIAAGGAQLIMGMRGCGKTMLLRSLDCHSRIAMATAEDLTKPLERIKMDHFVGIYVSGSRLLDARHSPDVDFRPILFTSFAREAIRVVRHLEAIGFDTNPQAAHLIAAVVRQFIANSVSAISEYPTAPGLDYELQRFQTELASGRVHKPLTVTASTAYQALATAISQATPEWGSVRVLFLLDDISTRYLDDQLIRKVLTEVLFQNEICSFKVTTETQTWISVLLSPGEVETIREDRDFKRFDLGERVARRLKAHGWKFLDTLLQKRLRLSRKNSQLSALKPSQIIGHSKLEDIAEVLATSGVSSAKRKAAYHGIEALAAICVGDIGDTITLFDRMLEKVDPDTNVVSPKAQSEVYQTFCGSRLWELASRDVDFKEYALGFAEASQDLLSRSAAKKSSETDRRLRQYTKLYVRDLSEAGFDRVRQLIDSGVFVLEGGIPRSKTKDNDVTTHHVLVFRKILGLSSFIPISDRDRFELSGEPLAEWLGKPITRATIKEILVRNQDQGEPARIDARDDDDVPDAASDSVAAITHATVQPGLFSLSRPEGTLVDTLGEATLPSIKVREIPSITGIEFGAYLGGMGFEDRSAVSASRISQGGARIREAYLVKYPGAYGNDSIANYFRSSAVDCHLIDDVASVPFDKLKGPALVDVTGLKTSFLWAAIRRPLLFQGEVWVAYTQAKLYSPSESEISAVRDKMEDDVDSLNLDALRDLVSGESGEYSFRSLLPTRDDIMRPLALVAAASPKMLRLESLIKQRSFDRLSLLSSSGDSARAWLSNVAARAFATTVADHYIHKVSTTDLAQNISVMTDVYRHIFVTLGQDIAFGLTGSKVQSVAMAAMSTAVKISEAWCVVPAGYNVDKFTGGAAETVVYRLSLSTFQRYDAIEVE